MKALVWTEEQRVAVRELPMPDTAGKILVRTAYAGICGSDVSVYLGKHPRAKAPLVMGHEFSGVVEQIGEGVRTTLCAGDRVTVNPLIVCGKCRPCLAGNTHVCRSLKLYGTDCDGGMAEYVAVPEHCVHPLPEETDLKAAAVTEPVAVVIHALRMIKRGYYGSVCVTGLGPMGLLIALMLRDSGVRRIFTVEANARRAEYARKLGFEVIDPVKTDVATYFAEQTGGEGVDVLIEATGSPAVAAIAAEITAVRGEILLLSVFKQPAALDLRAVNFKEQTIIGTRVYTQLDFMDAVHYVSCHRALVEAVISHVHPIVDGQAVFQDIISGQTNAMKVLFQF